MLEGTALLPDLARPHPKNQMLGSRTLGRIVVVSKASTGEVNYFRGHGKCEIQIAHLVQAQKA